ncbi:hypothetical protein BASA81_000515 [Batrachochytrium salamandrivorans]|nr:hypothetical protein BASA81_000515 [Batrachochytrium salamandrivorans]
MWLLLLLSGLGSGLGLVWPDDGPQCWNSTLVPIGCDLVLDTNDTFWPNLPATSFTTSSTSQYQFVLDFNYSSSSSELLVCQPGALSCDPTKPNLNSRFYATHTASAGRFDLTSERGGGDYWVVFSLVLGSGSRASWARHIQVLDSASMVLVPDTPMVVGTCYLPKLDKYLLLSKRSSPSASKLVVLNEEGVPPTELAFYPVGDVRFASAAIPHNVVEWSGEFGIMGGAIALLGTDDEDADVCLPKFDLKGGLPVPTPRYDALVCEWPGGALFLTQSTARVGLVEIKYWFIDGEMHSVYNETGFELLKQTVPSQSGREVVHVDWLGTLHVGSTLQVDSASCILSRSAPPVREIEYVPSDTGFATTSVSCDSSFGLINLFRLDLGKLQVDYYAKSSTLVTLDGQVLFQTSNAKGSFVLDASQTLWSLDSIIGQRLELDQGRSWCVVVLNSKLAGKQITTPTVNKAMCEFNGKALQLKQQTANGPLTLLAPFYAKPFLINPDPLSPSEFEPIYVSSATSSSPSKTMQDFLGLRLVLVLAGGGDGDAFQELGRCIVQAVQPDATLVPSAAPSTAPTGQTASPKADSIVTRSPSAKTQDTDKDNSSSGGGSGWIVVVLALAVLVGCLFCVLRRRRARRAAAAKEQEGLAPDTYHGRKLEEWSFQLELGKGLRVHRSTPPPLKPKFHRLSQDDEDDEDDLRHEDVTRI